MTDLDVNTRLAFERTRLAYDRTLMAWVRTATSMITFGFSFYKFFQIGAGDLPVTFRILDVRGFSLLLISLGLISLLVAAFEYRASMRVLKSQCAGIPESRLAKAVAAALFLLGGFALVVVLLRA